MSGRRLESLDDLPPKLRAQALAQIQEQESRRANRKLAQAMAENGIGTAKKATRKYHNLPTERLLKNGECVKFMSKKEAEYYDYLMLLVAGGTVRNVKLQYQFLLKPAYTDGTTGERFRAVTYNADFVFEKLEDGKWVEHIIDTKGGGRKGTKTDKYIIKRKLLAEKGVIIEEA